MPTVAPPPTASILNPALILPFAKSVRDVLKMMARIDVKVEPPQLKSNPAPEYDCSGIIAFSGNVVGTIVVSFREDAASALVAALAGIPMEPGTADFADALGELANMIAGAAKKDLGADASISVPTVVMGRGHVVARPSDIPCLVLPCTTEVGTFAIEISIKVK